MELDDWALDVELTELLLTAELTELLLSEELRVTDDTLLDTLEELTEDSLELSTEDELFSPALEETTELAIEELFSSPSELPPQAVRVSVSAPTAKGKPRFAFIVTSLLLFRVRR